MRGIVSALLTVLGVFGTTVPTAQADNETVPTIVLADYSLDNIAGTTHVQDCTADFKIVATTEDGQRIRISYTTAAPKIVIMFCDGWEIGRFFRLVDKLEVISCLNPKSSLWRVYTGTESYTSRTYACATRPPTPR